MRNRLSVFVLAIAILVMALPAHAQGRYQGSEFQRALNNVQSIPDGITRDLSRTLCENHRGAGDAMELSHCYGIVVDNYGQVVDRNPYAVNQPRPRYASDYPSYDYRYYDGRYDRYRGRSSGYHHQATQNNVNAWGAANLLATAIGTGIEIHQLNKINKQLAQPEPQYDDPRPAQVVQPRSASFIVTNRTGECLRAYGRDLPNREVMEVPGLEFATPVGSTCHVHAYRTGQASTGQVTYDLACQR